MTDGKRVIPGFDSRRLHNDNEGLASPSDERGQNVANFGACRICAIPLLSYRARGNGLCGPCTRADVEDFAQRLDSAGHGGAAENVRREAAETTDDIGHRDLKPENLLPRLTDVEAQYLATSVVTAPSGEVPTAIGRLADKVLELLARLPCDALRPQPPPANPPRGPAVWPLVIEEAEETERDPRLIAMMRARDKQGRVKYGVPLCANDGRNTAMDALQEALDLIAYLRKRRAEGRSSPHYWQRNVSDIAIALIDEIEREAAPPTASPGSSGEAGKQCVTCGFASPLQALEPVDGPTIDAFCPTCGWMGEVPR